MSDPASDEMIFLEGALQAISAQRVTLNEATSRAFSELGVRLQAKPAGTSEREDALRVAELEIKRVNAVASMQILADLMDAYLTSTGADAHTVEAIHESLRNGMFEVNEMFADHRES